MEHKNKVIEVIKLILEGYKHSDDEHGHFLHQNVNGKDYYLWDCDYLLNQVARHYNVPLERQYYSKSFNDLWNNLGPQKYLRKDCRYQEKIVCEKNGVRCLLYKGASKTPYSEISNKGDNFPFRAAFHLEHIIPISVIVNQLVELKDPSDESIEKVLEQICIARITKEEDRMMHNSNKRPHTFEGVYNSLYKDAGIVLYRETDESEVKYNL